MAVTCAGNHSKAYRIAREIVKSLNPADIEWLINEHMDDAEFLAIRSAIDQDYEKDENEVCALYEQIKAALSSEEDVKLLSRYDDALHKLACAEQKAHFHLGFAAATRLMGNTPTMGVVSRGVTELKATLRGACKP
jgi:hypothetical protein